MATEEPSFVLIPLDALKLASAKNHPEVNV